MCTLRLLIALKTSKEYSCFADVDGVSHHHTGRGDVSLHRVILPDVRVDVGVREFLKERQVGVDDWFGGIIDLRRTGGGWNPGSGVGYAFLFSVRPPTSPIGSLIPSIPTAHPSCESGSPSVVPSPVVIVPSSVVVVG